MKNYFIILSVFLLSLSSLGAQTPNDDEQLFSSEQLIEDADFYFKTLFENQPNPYEYSSLVEFENLKDSIYAQLTRPMSAEDFMWIIGRVNSLSSYHTGINLKYNPYTIKCFEKAKENDLKLFPRIHLHDGNMAVKVDGQMKRLAKINGISTETIVNFLESYYNDKLSINRNTYYMESYFALWIESYYKIKYPYNVEFEGEQGEVTLDGISASEFMDFSAFGIVRAPLVKQAIYPSSSIGIFTVSAFNPRRIPVEELETQLSAFRDSVNRYDIKHLFLDLSKNSGGTSRLSYPLLDIVEHDTIFDRFSSIQKEKLGNRKYKHRALARLPIHNLYKSDKQLFVLQGTNTISAANYLCRMIKLNQLGVLVGQASGEPTTELSAGSHFSMPNTKLNFIVAGALIDFSDYFPKKDKDLLPDIYYDVDYKIDFEEKELMQIVDKWNKQIN